MRLANSTPRGPRSPWPCMYPRGAACSNSRPGAKTFGGLEGGGAEGGRGVGGSAGQPPGSLEEGQWVPQHTYLKMIPMTR